MSIRLYESAWVTVEGVEEPCQARRDPSNGAVFIVHGDRYDVDARALSKGGDTPVILSILSLQAMRESGLRSGYNRDVTPRSK